MKSHQILFSAGALALTAIPLQAGNLGVSFVTDTTEDSVVRCEDLDSDGTYNGPGEATTYYDENLGTVLLGNNAGITMDDAGIVYVCDTSSDIVLAMIDLDGDGECNDVGEHWIFFDGDPTANASGITMNAPNNLYFGPSGKFWVANAGTSSTGADEVIWLDDLNSDGDANDAGEAFSYFQAPGTGSIPQDVQIGLDGQLYYLENGPSGNYAKGVYILKDIDGSGFIDPYAEVFTFYNPPALANTPFHWAMDQAPDGSWYMADSSSNETIWKFRDDNGDDYITPGVEDVAYFTNTASSLIWSVNSPDGTLYCNESQSPDRMLHMVDNNGDGVIDPTEVVEIYDEGLSPLNIGNPRGLLVLPVDDPGVAYCSGDGSGTQCPCGNNSDGAEVGGCDWGDPAFPSGGNLAAVGSNSIAADNAFLIATGVANNFGIFFGADNQVNSGNGNPLNDGLRCAGGNLVRLIPPTVAVGNSQVLPMSVQALDTAAVAGVTRRYQYWFRSPGGPCSQDANLTNGYEIVWVP